MKIATVQLAGLERVSALIHFIRGHKVMLDSDLAALYGVPTKQLKRAVGRHCVRFPDDFMFRLSKKETESLRCQIGTSKIGRGGSRYLPFAFTEQGVAMLSGILNSQRAVQVNIAIMRAFVRMRQVLETHKDLAARLEKLERQLLDHDAALTDHADQIKTIFEALHQLMQPPEQPKRRIGFIQNEG